MKLCVFIISLAIWNSAFSNILGSFEITAQRGANGNGKLETVLKAFEKEGFIVDRLRQLVKDPQTKAVFWVHIDGSAIEFATPPVKQGQATKLLSPIYSVLNKLGWKHTTGGGHCHWDLALFKENPRAFVNMLIWIHNLPLSQRIFLPVEGENTVFQVGKQGIFISAVAEFRKIENPTWDDVFRIFSDIFKDGLKIEGNTVEWRFLGNQKRPSDADLQLKVFDALWDLAVEAGDQTPIEWTWETYNKEISYLNVNQESEFLFDILNLDSDPYRNWINDYPKTRRRALERLMANFENLDSNSELILKYLPDAESIEKFAIEKSKKVYTRRSTY